MRIKILTVGSRGDVQPFIALGSGLQKAGHHVTLATHGNYETLVRERGLDFFPLQGNLREMVGSDAGQAMLGTGRNFVAFMREFMNMMNTLLPRLLADSVDACQDADVILYSTFSFFGYHIAEKLGVQSIGTYLCPVSRTHEFPSIGAPALPLGGGYNWLTYVFMEQTVWQPFRTAINRWRVETLGLAPVPFFGILGKVEREPYPFLYGYSPNVVPKPRDWGPWRYVTGYWFLNTPLDWRPPADLVDFIRSGPPPVYVGFGSMSSGEAERITAIVTAALKRTRQRGILATGWGGLSAPALGDDFFAVEFVPHDWLFPQMAAVVHHGGAGTTAAGLRAGVPSIIVPFFADQPFWGERVAALGVGPKPTPHQMLSVDRLAAAIADAVGNPGMRERAAALGRKVCAEDGLGNAVAAFEEIMRGRH